MSADPFCRICHERKSAHVATAAGPFTHPREARGEGTYRRVGGGVHAESFPGACDEIEWDRWEFVPTPAATVSG